MLLWAIFWDRRRKASHTPLSVSWQMQTCPALHIWLEMIVPNHHFWRDHEAGLLVSFVHRDCSSYSKLLFGSKRFEFFENINKASQEGSAGTGYLIYLHRKLGTDLQICKTWEINPYPNQTDVFLCRIWNEVAGDQADHTFWMKVMMYAAIHTPVDFWHGIKLFLRETNGLLI